MILTLDYLKEVDKKVKLIPLTFDLMFKYFFKSNEYAFKRFLISVLHLDILPEECTLYISDTDTKGSRYKEYHKIVDFNIKINDFLIVNLEINSEYYKDVKRRNSYYFDSLSSIILDRGEDISKLNNIKIIQLNLNTREKNVKYGEDSIYRTSTATKEIFDENNIIYIRYLDYYKTLYYNQSEKKNESDYWLASLMAESFTELYEVYSKFLDNDLRDSLIKDAIRLSMEDFMISDSRLKVLEELTKYTREERQKKEYAEMQAEIEKERADIASKKADIESKKADLEAIKADIESKKADFEKKKAKEKAEFEIQKSKELAKIKEQETKVVEAKNGIVKKMLKENIPYDIISRTTGLTLKQIEELQ